MIIAAAAMRRLYEMVDRVAPGDISVLIQGETGSGKELVARALHERSPRSKKPYLAINCGAFAESLLESELFGHEKGAFTGASEARAGLFESTQGGTVFLDEVGELPPSTQVKLLRVLEEKAVRRLGSNKSKPIDVRFVAATHRNLENEVKAGRFREDLYFRISAVTLWVPPLRERKEELAPLAKSFSAAAAAQLARSPVALSPDALQAMSSYSWPGNIRELKNVIERAVLLADGAIRPEHLPLDKMKAVLLDATPAPLPRPVTPKDASAERDRIVAALAECGGNQTQAAQRLGISRRTLVHRLNEYALPRPKKKV
jgi:transcriptional regulator with GAF, ATPase, and Fis domain